MWGRKISPIGEILCGDIKFSLSNIGEISCVGIKISPIGGILCGHVKFPYRGNFVWGHKIPPIGEILCGDIKFPL